MIAPSDNHPLNDVVPTDHLLDFLLPFWGRHPDPLISTSDFNASTSAIPLSEPPTSEDVTLQQLMDEVRTLFVEQTSFQLHILEEHQCPPQQHQ